MTDAKAGSATDKRFNFVGVNHVALVCRDMAETVEFYEDVLEMPLLKALDLPGGGQHFFFDCGNEATVAFFWFPNAPEAAPGIASQHADVRKNGALTAIGSMNHLAITIAPEDFDRYVEKLRAKGVDVSVINHNDPPHDRSIELGEYTWIRSMYFMDPNGVKMEFAAVTRPYGVDEIMVEPRNAKGERVPYKNRVTA